jgi:hypothetical protein
MPTAQLCEIARWNDDDANGPLRMRVTNLTQPNLTHPYLTSSYVVCLYVFHNKRMAGRKIMKIVKNVMPQAATPNL